MRMMGIGGKSHFRGAPLVALAMAGLLLGVTGCANTNNRDEDTRGASLLILDGIEATAGGFTAGTESTILLSDVLSCNDDDPPLCSVFNDDGNATFRNVALDPNAGSSGTSFYQDIQLYRYRVQYTRSDGRNAQGVDVPYMFDSVMNWNIPVNGTADVAFLLVRHAAKVERPLVDLIGFGDEFVISTNTRVDFWGRDIAGNEHQVFGWIDIEFADFG